MKTSIQSDYYDYAIFFETLNIADAPVKQLVIQSDADFECQTLEGCIIIDENAPGALDTLAGEHLPGLTIAIENTGNGQRWSNNPMQVPCIFGTGQNPFVLPVSYIMERNASFNITVTNNSTANLFRAYFTFSGRKLLP